MKPHIIFADAGSGGEPRHDAEQGGSGPESEDGLSEAEDPGRLIQQIRQEAAGNWKKGKKGEE
jgi:hypothetical protein